MVFSPFWCTESAQGGKGYLRRMGDPGAKPGDGASGRGRIYIPIPFTYIPTSQVERKFFPLHEWFEMALPKKISLWKVGQNWGPPRKISLGDMVKIRRYIWGRMVKT